MAFPVDAAPALWYTGPRKEASPWEYNPQFWQALDQLLARSALVIDRPKGSSHPRFPEMVYPLDYGYLENTASMDGEGVDVWVGTAQPPVLDGLLWVVDLPKGDVEVKLLYGCTPQERELAFQFLNRPPYLLAQLALRPVAPLEKS